MDDDLCEEMDGRLDIREERLEVRLEKTQAGLGLSIAGGLGSTPFKGDDEGIFVSKVTEGGPADKVDLRVINNFFNVYLLFFKFLKIKTFKFKEKKIILVLFG